MIKTSIISSILYPFLQLKFKEKIIFFLIIFFSLFLIFFDLLTLSILASVFFETDNMIIENIDKILNLIYKKINITLNFFQFKILIIVFSLIFRNVFYIIISDLLYLRFII